jgi:hypothetical protein
MDQERRLQLEADYHRTDYVVDDDPLCFTIRLDRPNTDLDIFLSALNASTWAFLTAYNPYSQRTSDDQNHARQAELVSLLKEDGYNYYQGRGVGEGWDEPSIFIIEITRESAIDIGKQFEQNAILWGSTDDGPELIWC